MSEELTIDDQHRYFLGGKHLDWPSPTLILNEMGIVNMPEHWSEEQADYYKSRGSAVHSATAEDDLDDDFAIDWLKSELRIPAQRWRNFVKDSKIVIDDVELPIYNPKLQIVGCLDRRGGLSLKSGIQRCLIDIKTGGVPEYTKLQLAFYELILDDGPYARYGVGLGKDPYELKIFNDPLDRQKALTLLSAYRIRKEYR